eukprot:COSAG06_NODE_51559_length_311_cov_0.834906_1_plen_50_part_10
MPRYRILSGHYPDKLRTANWKLSRVFACLEQVVFYCGPLFVSRLSAPLVA